MRKTKRFETALIVLLVSILGLQYFYGANVSEASFYAYFSWKKKDRAPAQPSEKAQPAAINTSRNLEWCSPVLAPDFFVDRSVKKFEKIAKIFPTVEKGAWHPIDCRSWSKVALLVPYRSRIQDLKILLLNIHRFLQRQQLDYRIFLIEPLIIVTNILGTAKSEPSNPNLALDRQRFNRAKLMNVGFKEAGKQGNYSCFVFHDVDLIPLNEQIPYNCSPNGPMHLAGAIDKFHFGMPYGWYFGGVSAMTGDQFMLLNGFSNRYWGWGGEDDDAALRTFFSHQRIQRMPLNVGRYSMRPHPGDKGNDPNQARKDLISETKFKWKNDGLSDLKYEVHSTDVEKLYTKFIVDIFPPAVFQTPAPSPKPDNSKVKLNKTEKDALKKTILERSPKPF